MNLNVSDIYFSKNEISLYEQLYAQLDTINQGRIGLNIMVQLLNYLKLDLESQNQIFTYMNLFKNTGYFERQDFYIFIRLASIFYSRNQVNKDLVCKFDTPQSFIDLLSDWLSNMIGLEKDKNIALPPPPAKAKLKRVHTISGSAVSTVNSTGDTGLARLYHQSSSSGSSSVSATSAVLQSLTSSSASASLFAAPNQRPTSSPHPNVVVPYANQSVPSLSSTLLLSPTTAQQDNSTKYSQTAKVSLAKYDEVDSVEDDVLEIWTISHEQKEYYKKQFLSLQTDLLGSIRGNVAKIFFEKSGLPVMELSRIWKLSDIDRDGALSLPEFCIAMHLVVLRRNNVDIPNNVMIPDTLLSIYTSLAIDGLHFLQPSSSSSSSNLFDSTKSLTFDTNTLLDVTEQLKYNSIARQSGGVVATKNWTQFNDSPVPAAESSRTSPEQLVNFDYNVEYIAKNPHIKHPVPVRLSPSSPNLAFECLQKESSDLPSIGDVSAEGSTLSFRSGKQHGDPTVLSSTSSILQTTSQQLATTTTGDNWQSQSKSVSVSHFTSPSLKSSRSNGSAIDPECTIENGNLDSCHDLEERIISRFKIPNEFVLPKNVTNIEDLHSTVRNLQEYSSTVTKINQEMLKEIIALTKLVRKLKNNHNN